MRLLALDLALDGYTGWTVWDSELDNPVVEYGQLRPSVPSNLKGQVKVQHLVSNLYCKLSELLLRFPDVLVVYEYTDWHRGLEKGDDYAIERMAQRNLGRAEAVLILAAAGLERELYPIGAVEAKREFGAMKKSSVARLLADEYHRFVFESEGDKKWWLRDTQLNQKLASHISDSMAIAKVVGRRHELGNLVRTGSN